MGVSGGGDGCGGDVAVGGDAEADGFGSAGGGQVGLGEFAGGGVEADAESFGFAGPVFAFGLGDAGLGVVADLFEAVALGGVDAEHGAADVLGDAVGAVCPARVAERDPPALEVARETPPIRRCQGSGIPRLPGPPVPRRAGLHHRQGGRGHRLARELAGGHVRRNTYFIGFPANVPDTIEFWAGLLPEGVRPNTCIVERPMSCPGCDRWVVVRRSPCVEAP